MRLDIFPATNFIAEFCGVKKICQLQSCRFCLANCLQNPDFLVENGPIWQGKFRSKKKILHFTRYRPGHYSALFITSLQHFDFSFFSPLPNFVDPENRVYCLFGAYVTATRRPIGQKWYFSKNFRATYMGPDRSKMTFRGAKGPSLDLVDVYRPPGGKKIPKKNIFNFWKKMPKLVKMPFSTDFKALKLPVRHVLAPIARK